METDVYQLLGDRLAAGEPTALATVVRTWGSTPQRAGAKALFTATGGVLGTIGGGCLEQEALLQGLEALRERQARLFEISLDHDADEDSGLICGGKALVFVALPGDELAQALALLRSTPPGAAAALATRLEGDGAGRCGAAEDAGGTAGDTDLAKLAAGALRSREGGLLETDAGRVYLDLVLPRHRLWIAGAGHVGKALARHACEVEFEVHVVDDRPDLCAPENIPFAAECHVGDIAEVLTAQAFGPEDYVVVVTRGHRHDLDALRAVVRAGAKYVGLIGSRRKIKLIGETLVAEGAASDADLAQVFAPIGLDIGGVTVDEIAISITAELIAVRRGVLESPGERRRRPRQGRSAGSCAGAVDDGL